MNTKLYHVLDKDTELHHVFICGNITATVIVPKNVVLTEEEILHRAEQMIKFREEVKLYHFVDGETK